MTLRRAGMGNRFSTNIWPGFVDALATLTPLHREALVQTYYAGRTVNEAAAVLGVPPGTVKSRVFYGLRALKVALDERGVS